MKLYRYRPNNNLLYKELKYQEFYFANYDELNDPFDLTINIDFKVKTKNKINYLLYFLYKSTLIVTSNDSLYNDDNLNKILLFIKDQSENSLREELKTVLFEKLKKDEDNNVFIEKLIPILEESFSSIDLNFFFSLDSFKNEYDRIVNKFLKNAYTLSFSSTKNNFIM